MSVVLLLFVPLFAQAAQSEVDARSDEAGTSVAAQQSGTQPTATESSAARTPNSVGRQTDSSAQPVPVPAELWTEFLEWRGTPTGRAYSVISVALSGQASDDRAELEATFSVLINREDVLVKVPLALNEAVLTGFDYQGNGENIPGDRSPGETGTSWWFKGKGRHELTLSITVPIIKQVQTSRLQLTLPATAISHLKLAVPIGQLTLKQSETSWMKSTPMGDAGTEIEMNGLGTTLDLQWQAIPDRKRVKTFLQSTTSVTIELPGDAVLLKAVQQIKALSGSFERVRVRLPDGFELLDIDCQSYSSHHPDAEDPNWVDVVFTEPTTGPVDLNWTLESDFPVQGGLLKLDGFEVGNARRQVGEIKFRNAEGYRVTRREGRQRGVHRSDVTGNGQYATAYRFYRQPFRLEVDINPIEPYFTAKPHVLLHLSETRADLHAEFEFDVRTDGGAVKFVELNWPNRDSEGWGVSRLEPTGLFKDVSQDQWDSPGPIRIPLTERRAGKFKMNLRASRELSSPQETIRIHLPIAKATKWLPTTLVVENAENVDSEIIADTGAPLVQLDGGTADRGKKTFRIDSATPSILAKVTRHDQRIRVDTTAEAELRSDRLLVTQQILYDVAYERLPQVRLMVPQALKAESVTFHLGTDTVLKPTWTSREVGTFRHVRCPLPKPRIGKFVVEARYSVNLSEELIPGREQAAIVPLIQSSDAESSSVKFRFRVADRVDVDVADSTWQRELSSDNTTAWFASEPKADVPLTLSYSSDDSSQDYVIRKALIRSVFDLSGTAMTTAQYRIHGDVSSLMVAFPKEAVPDGFWWDRNEVPSERFFEANGDVVRFRLKVPDQLKGGNHLLTIGYRMHGDLPFSGSGRHQLVAPKFPPSAWFGQTVWEITLPADQHLFSPPSGFTSQFGWKRGTVFWSRVATHEYSSLDRWISSGYGSFGRYEEVNGNSYVFSRYGPSTSMEFRSMSQSNVLLFGAGLALAGGFVLLKIPVTRSVLTLLSVAFAVSVVSLWYAAQVRLLLQPAMLGLLLAVGAMLIEGMLKRERSSSVVALSPADDIVGTAASSSTFEGMPSPVAQTDVPGVSPSSVVSASGSVSLSDMGRST